MKFRNTDEKGVVYCIMSDSEADKYELPEVSLIENDLPYKVKDGDYSAVINTLEVKMSVKIYQNAGGYIGKIVANDVEISVIKGKPLRRQDILRAVIKRLGLVSKKGVDVAG